MKLPLNTSANTRDAVAQARCNMIEQKIRPWNVLDTDVLELQHVGIQHVPGPDLLLDHVVAGLGDGVAGVGGRVQWQIHRRSPVGVRVRTNPEF